MFLKRPHTTLVIQEVESKSKGSNGLEVISRGICQYCGDDKGPFEADHFRPRSRGGTHNLDNMACSCVPCNRQKGLFLIHEWIAWRVSRGLLWPPPVIKDENFYPRKYA